MMRSWIKFAFNILANLHGIFLTSFDAIWRNFLEQLSFVSNVKNVDWWEVEEKKLDDMNQKIDPTFLNIL